MLAHELIQASAIWSFNESFKKKSAAEDEDDHSCRCCSSFTIFLMVISFLSNLHSVIIFSVSILSCCKPVECNFLSFITHKKCCCSFSCSSESSSGDKKPAYDSQTLQVMRCWDFVLEPWDSHKKKTLDLLLLFQIQVDGNDLHSHQRFILLRRWWSQVIAQIKLSITGNRRGSNC